MPQHVNLIFASGFSPRIFASHAGGVFSGFLLARDIRDSVSAAMATVNLRATFREENLSAIRAGTSFHP